MVLAQGLVVKTNRVSGRSSTHDSGLSRMRAAWWRETGRGEVAAFPAGRLRHFQKQGSVKEELKRSGRRVQVEL